MFIHAIAWMTALALLWQRHDCFRSIEVLSFMIPTLTMVFVFMIKTWSSVVVEEMDGLCLECVQHAVEDEGFSLELACELIGRTPQKEGIQVMLRENPE